MSLPSCATQTFAPKDFCHQISNFSKVRQAYTPLMTRDFNRVSMMNRDAALEINKNQDHKATKQDYYSAKSTPPTTVNQEIRQAVSSKPTTPPKHR